MNKICTRCNEEKDFEKGFAIKRTNGDTIYRQSWCRSCQSNYHDKYYEKNKPIYIRKAARRKKRLRNMVQEAKSVPCMDCGHSFPAVCMDFDHIRDDKEFNVSNSKYDFKRVIAEMNKCEIVCSNCHRIRTAKRLLSASVTDNISGFDPEDSTFES